jgi:predicted NUDIX family NTP pyrophosphohydrolase
MKKDSAGVLMYRKLPGRPLELLLVHPGGPFWAKKDVGAWSVPKGEFDSDEDGLEAAKREFREETGREVDGEFKPLMPVKQKSGKIVHVWAVEGDWDPTFLVSNTFELEWPRGSGRVQSYPEVDKAAWFDVRTARTKLHAGQVVLVDQLLELLGVNRESTDGEASGTTSG